MKKVFIITTTEWNIYDKEEYTDVEKIAFRTYENAIKWLTSKGFSEKLNSKGEFYSIDYRDEHGNTLVSSDAFIMELPLADKALI